LVVVWGDEEVSRVAVDAAKQRELKVNPTERNVTTIFGRLAQQNKDVGESLTVRSFQPGETVCRAEDMASSLFLVASGRVQLYRTSREGRSYVVATLGQGSMFGEDSLLGGEGPDTYAVALEPCTVWAMPSKQALEISSTDAMFGFGLMQAMGQRVMEAENRLEQMAYSTIASRLAALLLELGANDLNDVVHATHQELADMLGTWRETVSKTLQDFRRRGWVASGRRQLRLLNKDALELEAGGVL
jgi:CRP-like cAMP-binding protein